MFGIALLVLPLVLCGPWQIGGHGSDAAVDLAAPHHLVSCEDDPESGLLTSRSTPRPADAPVDDLTVPGAANRICAVDRGHYSVEPVAPGAAFGRSLLLLLSLSRS